MGEISNAVSGVLVYAPYLLRSMLVRLSLDSFENTAWWRTVLVVAMLKYV